MYALVAHGGAGTWRPEKHKAALEGVEAAVRVGRERLAEGASALDAVIATVMALEDAPVFNAGTGACLNVDGEIRMDAAVMVGKGLRTGCVANIQRVRHPVLVAQKVMEVTDHIILADEGADRFARALGFEDYDPTTPERLAVFQDKIAKVKRGEDDWLPKMRALLEQYPELAHGTVGAVAIDQAGECAAATSTGGLTLKLAGRIGDTPVPGAGNYATPFGAASATGRGELMLRTLTTRAVCDRVEGGENAQAACNAVIANMVDTVGREAGVIAVDRNFQIGIAHASTAMPHAWTTSKQNKVTTALSV